MTELTEAFISRVFLTYRGTLLPAGALGSIHRGTLMFRWTLLRNLLLLPTRQSK